MRRFNIQTKGSEMNTLAKFKEALYKAREMYLEDCEEGIEEFDEKIRKILSK